MQAVAEVGVFAGDAVGEGMQMRFADDDCACCSKLFDEPGILRGVGMKIAIEAHATTGGRASEIEAVFDRDGEAPERGAAVGEWACGAARHGFGTMDFGIGPGLILPEVGVVAGVLAGTREGFQGER